MSDKAKKPLAKRVTWLKFSATGYQVTMSGVCLVMHKCVGGIWSVESMRRRWSFHGVRKVSDAKARALVIVQDAVLEAAEAWRD
jgi:hypothetical protein